MKKFTPFRALTITALNTLTLLLLGVLLSFSACKSKEVPIPSYLYVGPFTLTTDLGLQGNPSAKITDAHVFINGKFQGIYELPIVIPVITEGPATVVVIPGVKENGANANRKIIRTLEAYEKIVEFSKTQIDSIFPSTTYKSNVKFDWIEDFELGTISTAPSTKNTHNDTIKIIDRDHPQAFKGPFSNYSAAILIPQTKDRVFFEHASIEKFLVPGMGRDIYLELDYKTNIELQIGIYVDKPDMYEQIPFIILNPTQEWNKIYINLSVETSVLPPNSPIQIFYGFVKPKDVEMSPEVYLDNIKLNYLN